MEGSKLKGGKKKKSNSINNSKVKKNIPLEEKERGRERGGEMEEFMEHVGGFLLEHVSSSWNKS